jgi:hypothetical protein
MPTGARRAHPTGRQLDARIVIQRAADRLFTRLLVLSVGATVVAILAAVAFNSAVRP